MSSVKDYLKDLEEKDDLDIWDIGEGPKTPPYKIPEETQIAITKKQEGLKKYKDLERQELDIQYERCKEALLSLNYFINNMIETDKMTMPFPSELIEKIMTASECPKHIMARVINNIGDLRPHSEMILDELYRTNYIF